VTQPKNQITVLPDEPFFEGSEALADLDQWGFPVAIDNRPFILDTESQQFSRRSVQLLNTQNQDGKGDVSSIPPEVWRRNAESWHLGAGQDRLDRQDSLPHRYEDSRHIDPWSEFSFGLLPETTLLRPFTTNDAAFTQVVQNTYLFVGLGASGWWWDDIDVNTPTAVSFPAEIVAVTSDGNDLFVLLSDGQILQVPPLASAGTPFATIPLVHSERGSLTYIKGWLVAGAENVLYQVTQGNASPLTTHHQNSWTWRAGCDGLSVGYILGGAGDKWTINRLGLKQDATGLEPPIVAATLPDGEVGYALASYLGYVMVGLNTGWRFCMPAADGSLTYGQLVTTDAPVECFEGQDRFVWYGMSEKAGQQKMAGDVSGLGRADLSNFTAPMTPAYARDIDAGGTHVGRVGSCSTYDVTVQDKGRRVFTVDGVGVFVEARTLCQEGWLTQGAMTFGTADRKRGLYVMATHEPLDGEVFIDVSTDSGLWTQVGFDDFQGSIAMGNMAQRRPFYLSNVRYRLHRPSIAPSLGPRLTRMEYRAIPIVGTTTEWVVPIMLSEQITWDNVSQARSVHEDYEFLVGLVKERRRFIYREGTKRWVLYAIDFDWRPSKVTHAADTFQGVFHLVARELD
jgi:hypothetical protein